MSRVNQDMSEMRAACAAVDANAEWLRCAKADGIQLWWNIGERGRRQNDAGARIVIERRAKNSYVVMSQIPQDATYYSEGSRATLAEGRKLAISLCDELYR